MTDIPIPMTAANAQSCWEGRKTQTRRGLERMKRFGKVTEFGTTDTEEFDWCFRDKEARWNDLRHDELLSYLPYRIGDRLWVREPWRAWAEFDDQRPSEIECDRGDLLYIGERPGTLWDARKRHARFMPRWASRMTLLVTDVRVERLQDISEADAKDEGVEFLHAGYHDGDEVYRNYLRDFNGNFGGYGAALWSFRSLWISIHGDDPVKGWKANPWVIAISFETIRQNIGEVSQ